MCNNATAVYDKELSLRNELSKEDPDTGKTSTLQNEISRLQSILDQKRLEFQIQARNSAPSYNRRFRDMVQWRAMVQ